MFEKELQTALEAAQKASDYLREAYDHFEVVPNAPATITTEADRQSQEIILQHINQAFPDDALSAEESTPSLPGAKETGSRLWIVDPIDGTRGFAQKNGEFSIMIGFVENGTIGVGVVSEPGPSRLTYAVQGGGCWKIDGDGDKEQCRVTSTDKLANATLVQSRSKRAPGMQSKWAQILKPARVVETFSAGIKLALVARGEADIYVNSYEAFRDWDICAGHLLVTEAGGRVTDMHGGELRYGTEGAWQRDGLLATNGALHEGCLERLQGEWK